MTSYLDELAPLAPVRRELAAELGIDPAEVLGRDLDVLERFLAIARRRLRDAPTELLS